MAKNRTGKDRKFKSSFVVLGEGITEQYYLYHLKNWKGYRYSIKPSLFADITLEKAEGIIDEYYSGGAERIIFFTDYDIVLNQGKMNLFNQLLEKYKNCEEVVICDSMPSIEMWFLLHFINTSREFMNCDELLPLLRNHLPEYRKKKDYLANENWFKLLIEKGNLAFAQNNAKKLTLEHDSGEMSAHYPFSRVFHAFQFFK